VLPRGYKAAATKEYFQGGYEVNRIFMRYFIYLMKCLEIYSINFQGKVLIPYVCVYAFINFTCLARVPPYNFFALASSRIDSERTRGAWFLISSKQCPPQDVPIFTSAGSLPFE
jgi:hypothetical protein